MKVKSINQRRFYMMNTVVEPAIALVTEFMNARYGNAVFDNLGLHFTTRAKTSEYDRDKQEARIVLHGKWEYSDKWTDSKVKGTVDVGVLHGTALGLIREMTHHVQHMEERIVSDIEVSKNELDFLSHVDPQWNKLIAELTKVVNAGYKQWKRTYSR